MIRRIQAVKSEIRFSAGRKDRTRRFEKDEKTLNVFCFGVFVLKSVFGANGIAIFTGQKNSELSAIADVTVQVPQAETYMIQELHLPVYHCWCLMLEDAFFCIE